MTDPSPPDASRESSPQPRDPEQGWLTRWRSWRDVFPGLLLFDAVRPALWITLLLIGTLAYWCCALASVGIDRLAGRNRPRVIAPLHRPTADGTSVSNGSVILTEFLVPPFRPGAEAVDTFLSPAYAAVAGHGETLPGLPLPRRPSGGSMWWMLLHRLVHLVIWAIPAGMVLRYSVSTVAGQQRPGFLAAAALTGKRLIALLAVALIPLLAVGLASLFFLIPGWVSRASLPGEIIAEAISVLAAPIALAAGLLAFGSIFAVPLGWAAVMAEPEEDTFDAISRGYEYTMRRPFHLIGYILLAWLISRVLLFFANGICLSAAILSRRLFVLANGSDSSLTGMSVLHSFVMHLPSVFAALLFWALVGGIYLLMRRAANGQEVEEIGQSLANNGSMR